MEAVKLVCVKCKYEFSPKQNGRIPKRCPYCDKPETLEKVKSAQNYLEDSIKGSSDLAEER